MTNYKEILRLHSLGINNTRIAESCGCARSTVIAALQRAAEQELSWNKIKNCSAEEVARKLYTSTALGQQYKMPDYEWVHREMQKSGVSGIKRKEIAEQLFMSERTVSNHLQHIFEKLGVSSAVEAITKAIQLGYIPPL